MKIAHSHQWFFRGSGAVSAAAGIVCGIHCAAVPLFTAALLALGLRPNAVSSWEIGLMLSAVSLGAVTFLPAAQRERNPFPLQAALIAGVYFVASWQLDFFSPLLRQSLAISASVLLVLAHIQHQWQRKMGCPQAPQ